MMKHGFVAAEWMTSGSPMHMEEEPTIEPRPEVVQELAEIAELRDTLNQGLDRLERLIENRLLALDADREDIRDRGRDSADT